MPSETRDVEANLEGVELDIISVNEPLPDRSAKSSLRSTRQRRSLQVVTLDDIPPVIKSANGSTLSFLLFPICGCLFYWFLTPSLVAIYLFV